MAKLNVSWGKCGDDGHWCDFNRLDLTSSNFTDLTGVYIIFDSNNTAVDVGSGIIKDRIAAHRKKPEIKKMNGLKVTWAGVGKNDMQAVEKFLYLKYGSAVGERYPNVTPIEVNLPYSQ